MPLPDGELAAVREEGHRVDLATIVSSPGREPAVCCEGRTVASRAERTVRPSRRLVPLAEDRRRVGCGYAGPRAVPR